MNRRYFLGLAISVVVYVLILPSRWIRSLFTRFRIGLIDRETIRTFSCFADHVFPPDHEDGALALGIADFCESQSGNDHYATSFRAVRRIVVSLDKTAAASGYPSFSAMPRERQAGIVTTLTEKINQGEMKPLAADFNLCIDFILDACFSDPLYGGNKNKNAWRLLGSSLNENWFYA